MMLIWLKSAFNLSYKEVKETLILFIMRLINNNIIFLIKISFWSMLYCDQMTTCFKFDVIDHVILYNVNLCS